MAFQRSMLDWRRESRSASRSAKFGVVVLKASILNWQGGKSAKFGVTYSRHLWSIDRGSSASTSAKFGVAVFKASMFNWRGGGVDLPADLPILNSFTFHALLHRRSFRITYERPNNGVVLLTSERQWSPSTGWWNPAPKVFIITLILSSPSLSNALFITQRWWVANQCTPPTTSTVLWLFSKGPLLKMKIEWNLCYEILKFCSKQFCLVKRDPWRPVTYIMQKMIHYLLFNELVQGLVKYWSLVGW